MSLAYSVTLLLRRLTKKATGDAMNKVDIVPIITPNNIAKMNERIESPPRIKITSNTNRVEHDVMIVRPNVELSDLLTVVKKSCLG
jgi:hypothetical protein